MLDNTAKEYIQKSVLCWLATCNTELEPNVSPKEIFTCSDDATLLIAHIASPNSIDNIRANPKVCVSFIDIFVQKGYKLKGWARVIEKNHAEFAEKVTPLSQMVNEKFPILAVIEVIISKVEKIQAPSYFLFPETTEAMQIGTAMSTYHVKPD